MKPKKSTAQAKETTFRQTIESPVGSLTLVSDGEHLTGVWFGPTAPKELASASDKPDVVLKKAVRQFKEYFAGKRKTFDLPLRAKGTEFQTKVWKALESIPFGQTISYGELAKRIKSPKAVRAVGRANGANPLSIVRPCHRVIGADGTLTGYGGGLKNKLALLELEGWSDKRA